MKPELLLCLQLDLVGESTRCGVGESSRGVREFKVRARSGVVTPPKTFGRFKQRELLLLLAAAVATLGDGTDAA